MRKILSGSGRYLEILKDEDIIMTRNGFVILDADIKALRKTLFSVMLGKKVNVIDSLAFLPSKEYRKFV